MRGRKQPTKLPAHDAPNAVQLYRLQTLSGNRFVKLTNQILAGHISLVNAPRRLTGSHSSTSKG